MKNLFSFKTIVFLFSIILSFGHISCTSQITGPSEENVEPGRRDYIWKVDTLNLPFTTLDRIWGTSPTDIWAVGSGDADKSIQHYDGTRWANFTLWRWGDPHSIFGLNNLDVWSCTSDGKICRFTGYWWFVDTVISIEEVGWVYFQDIWGSSKEWFFAAGLIPYKNPFFIKSALYQRVQSGWRRISTSELDTNSQFVRLSGTKNRLLLLQAIDYYDGPDSTKIIEYDGHGFKTLFLGSWNSEYFLDLHSVNGVPYIMKGRDLYSYVDGEVKFIYRNTLPEFAPVFCGRSSKDILFVMRDGITHYDGFTIEYVYRFPKNPSFMVRDTFILEKDVYFLVTDFGKGLNYVIHGSLP